MKITGIDHITINVKDLEASKNFYETVFGLKFCGFIDMGDHTLTYYELPAGIRLELIDFMEKGPEKDLKETDIGIYRHFCLEVDSLDELYETCRKHQVTVTKTPSFVEKLGVSNMLLLDPAGVEVEIFEKV